MVVFIIGGVTYQENRELQVLARKQGFEAIIGSNTILNSDKYTQIMFRYTAQLEKLMNNKREPIEDENERLLKKLA